MTGEGGKALLNALFIADIHQKFVKYADLAALVSRDQEAALRHGAQQARCFQGDSFATGVRSGDDQRIVISAQSNIHRHALLGSISGWRARISEKESSVRTAGLNALRSKASRAFASRTSISSIAL